MNATAIAYEQLIDRFIGWAHTDGNLRAAGIVGSRARADHPADEWSDLDVLLVATDPQPYCARFDWLHQIGAHWLTFVEPTADGMRTERRVLFEGGLDVDFIPCSVADVLTMVEHGFPAEVAEMIHRGVRFLLDKDGIAARLNQARIAPPPLLPPSEAEFLNVVNDFWYHSVWTGKHLRRGELWWGKSACDDYLKQLLRQMLEWHARARRGEEVDVWARGRFLEEWVDHRALESLPRLFAHYDEADVWRALRETMALFRWVAAETAEVLRYSYPVPGQERATELVERMFFGRSHSQDPASLDQAT